GTRHSSAGRCSRPASRKCPSGVLLSLIHLRVRHVLAPPGGDSGLSFAQLGEVTDEVAHAVLFCVGAPAAPGLVPADATHSRRAVAVSASEVLAVLSTGS